MSKYLGPYDGLTASLLTQHGKESVISPELLGTSGLNISHVTGYDTDQLGTFTREVRRFGSQLDAARKKARIGMEISGHSIGIGSEGAFTTDPFTGMLPWNYELIVLIDDVRNIEITGFVGGTSQSASITVSKWDELTTFLSTACFPSHQLVVRPEDEYHSECRKGISNIDSLKEAYDWAINLSRNKKAFIENDLRAHTNPTRMANILKAAQDLSMKINSICPICESPGYSITEIKKGLPCSCCKSPTNLPTANIWSCVKCEYKNQVPITTAGLADPSKCNYCNP